MKNKSTAVIHNKANIQRYWWMFDELIPDIRLSRKLYGACNGSRL